MAAALTEAPAAEPEAPTWHALDRAYERKGQGLGHRVRLPGRPAMPGLRAADAPDGLLQPAGGPADLWDVPRLLRRNEGRPATPVRFSLNTIGDNPVFALERKSVR
jgi:hypothetical protein